MWTHVDVFGRGSLVREREQARASAVSELVAVLVLFGYTLGRYALRAQTPNECRSRLERAIFSNLKRHGIRFSERVPRRDFAEIARLVRRT